MVRILCTSFGLGLARCPIPGAPSFWRADPDLEINIDSMLLSKASDLNLDSKHVSAESKTDTGVPPLPPPGGHSIHLVRI